MGNFSILVMLFIIIASLLGMEFFAYKIRFDEQNKLAKNPEIGNSPRINYDNLGNSFIATFILLSNEGWNQILYDHLVQVIDNYVNFLIIFLTLFVLFFV